MSKTTDIHPRVAAHREAVKAKADGHPSGWRHTIYLKSVLRDDSNSFEDKCQKLAETIQASAWYKADVAESPDGDLWGAVDELSTADDVEHLDYCLSVLYDLADHDRVWFA